MLHDMMDWENGYNGLTFLSCFFDKFHLMSDGTTVNVLVHVHETRRALVGRPLHEAGPC